MRREKFVFNPETLQYDKMVEPLRYTLLRYGALFCAALMVAGLFTILIHRYLPSPSERMARQENEIMRNQLNEMENEMELYTSVLSNIQERDAFGPPGDFPDGPDRQRRLAGWPWWSRCVQRPSVACR